MPEIGDIFSHEYDVERGPVKMLNLGRQLGAELLGATLFEVQAGTAGLYHLHHANEEWLVVLEGTPTLRTPTEERELRPSQTVVFPRGPEGAHAISNFSGKPARWVVFSTMNHPEVGAPLRPTTPRPSLRIHLSDEMLRFVYFTAPPGGMWPTYQPVLPGVV
jgi:uncharacterized cupin superfamily protein